MTALALQALEGSIMSHYQLSKTKIGVAVLCPTCGLEKKPRGRSAPIGPLYCSPQLWDYHGCPGYYDEPRVGDLWPGESEADFGYPASDDGTRDSAEKCFSCGGSGEIGRTLYDAQAMGIPDNHPCPRCDGSGYEAGGG